MKITSELTDDVILKELGGRLASARIDRNLTQADLAEQAGLAKRTIERLESGQVATQLSGFLRVCRVLGLMDGFETLIPEHTATPMELLKTQGRKRKRASRTKAATGKTTGWTWSDSK